MRDNSKKTENDMRDELFAEDTEELAEKRMLLGVLKDALDNLLPEEREIAEKVFGEEMSVYEYARVSGKNRILSFHCLHPSFPGSVVSIPFTAVMTLF